MTPALALLLWLAAPPDAFTRFTYCRESARGAYEMQCVTLNPEGKGGVRFKRRGAEEIQMDVALSNPGRERYLEFLAATNYIEDGQSYESGKKVADLGLKRITIETPNGQRHAEFNFSTRKDVSDLANFFDGLINQETLGFDIDTALQFDRLSIPKRLDQIENELKANRIGDPEGFTVVLDKIANDARVVNYARDHATKLKEQILAKKIGKG